MAVYNPPLRDLQFVYHELLDPARLQALPGCEEFDGDLVNAVLEEAGKLCAEVLFPLNRSGDEEGCHFENGEVRTPAGFKEAYQQFVAGGWTAIACDTEYGGQGLPNTVNVMVEEMICSTNLSFGMYPGLSHGAYNAIKAHGSEELKNLYLPKLTDGTWSGTMCLTEPQCGTDLGLVRTKAVPQSDGSYRITGTKIFISAGEHDLTENIVHLVLARLPDAPAGIKGISLFLVPKFLPDANGDVGGRNGVVCGSIEHKMGIKASSTCVMNFDDATGWLLGQPHKGMRAMFTMMNTARLDVGIQGIGLGESAYQGAVEYARERIQGRALKGAQFPEKAADPLFVHPDVRRMLLTQRAYVEGARALAGWLASEIDVYQRSENADEVQAAEDLVALLIPVLKSFGTDMGFECANLGVQVYGGHGYIRENGMEQYVRDARITQIYEGTNGIQALDLVGRKLPAHMGRYLRRFFHPVADYIEAHKDDEALAEFIGPLAKVFGRLQKATAFIAEKGMRDPNEAGAASVDYQRLFALTTLAYLWTRMAEIALAKVDGGESQFYQAKIDTARFYMQRLLPQGGGLFGAILAGGKSMMAFNDEAF
ncbi:MAG: acyl-CoA dehydrogenase [Proteobacteria bacterium]|nr:MAG: acyl-CoA dehydrogenase [Pseudomonadota bacterium]QKK11441.1 MAG: acyl-CoA dehydrogenase [Pseudomonadota bacterium]